MSVSVCIQLLYCLATVAVFFYLNTDTTITEHTLSFSTLSSSSVFYVVYGLAVDLSAFRLANRPGMAGIIPELTHGVLCPGRGSFCPGNVKLTTGTGHGYMAVH